MKHYKELGGYQHTQAQKNILDLTWEKRVQIIFQLLELRESYPKILFNEEIVLEMMLSKNAKETTDHCNMPQRTLTLDLNLNRELLCVLGANVDCSKCGCPFPYEQEARKRVFLIRVFSLGGFLVSSATRF